MLVSGLNARSILYSLVDDVRNKRISLPQFRYVECHAHIWSELVYCIVSSQESSERARHSSEVLISKLDFFAKKNVEVEEILEIFRVNGGAPRFSRRKSLSIQHSWVAFKHIEEILPQGGSIEVAEQRKLRQTIAELFHGIGTKQASMFLRNIGRGDSLAIVDSQVSWFLYHVYGLTVNPQNRVSYLEAEEFLYSIASEFEIALSSLDALIWITARTVKTGLSRQGELNV